MTGNDVAGAAEGAAAIDGRTVDDDDGVGPRLASSRAVDRPTIPCSMTTTRSFVCSRSVLSVHYLSLC